MRPLLTIIIPTFNSINTLSHALESILIQSFNNYEILIIDNKSEDGTIGLIKEMVSLHDKIRWISETDNGIYDAMNKGIKLAYGDWIYFLGSDDYLVDRNIFNDLFSCFKSDIDLIYGNVIWGNTETIYDGVFDLEKLIKYKNICQQAIFYNKNLFCKIGLFETKFKYCADHYFNIQCFIASKKIVYVDKIMAYYNNEGRSSLLSDDNFQKKRILLLIEKYENPIEVYEKFLKCNDQITCVENSSEYKLGHIILLPYRYLSKKIHKIFK